MDNPINNEQHGLNNPVLIHDQLNPVLWDTETNKLLPDVREALLNIYNDFLESNFTDNSVIIPIVDLHLLGSQAGYNYTEHSDIDLHLLVNFELLYEKDEVLQLLYQTVTRKFNSDLDITVKGIPVELYIQDLKSVNRSTGVYSVFEDKWIQEPGQPPEIDQETLETANEIADELIAATKAVLDNRDSTTLEEVEQLINDIYVVRKQSLTEFNEFSAGNLAFKILRNTGMLDEIKELHKELRGKELSLTEGVMSDLDIDMTPEKEEMLKELEDLINELKEDEARLETARSSEVYEVLNDIKHDKRRIEELKKNLLEGDETMNDTIKQKLTEEVSSQETYADTSIAAQLTALVNSEIEAINLYTSVIETMACEKTKVVLEEILQDEKDHINLLSNLVDSLVEDAFPTDETVEGIIEEAGMNPVPVEETPVVVATTEDPGTIPTVALLSEDAEDESDEISTEDIEEKTDDLMDEVKERGFEVNDDNTFSVTGSESGYTATVSVNGDGTFSVIITESNGDVLESLTITGKEDLFNYLKLLKSEDDDLNDKSFEYEE